MPQVTVYVRKEDLEHWEAIEKKSQFIHNALLIKRGLYAPDFKVEKGTLTKETLDKATDDIVRYEDMDQSA